MKVNGKTAKNMVLVNLKIKIMIFMKVNFKMDLSMEVENRYIIIKINIKVNLIMVSIRVREYINGIMVLFMKDNLKMVKEMVKVSGNQVKFKLTKYI
jgi:hypothetical protein